jgi:diamine N-acetyltransferase
MEPDLLLTGARAALGPLRPDLAAAAARWSNDPEVLPGLLRRGVHTPETEAAWIADAMTQGAARRPSAVCFTVYDLADAAPVGTAGLFEIDHLMGRASYGILLGERRGQGLGTDATRLVLRWAFEIIGLHNVLLGAMDWNAAGLRAYERAGFRAIGRRRGALLAGGRRCDEVLMDAIPADLT